MQYPIDGGRAADHLIARGDGQDRPTIAYHCAESRRFEEAYRYGRVAAQDAMENYAFSQAADLYGAVLRYREAAGGTVSVDARCAALRDELAEFGEIEELHTHNSHTFWREIRDVSLFDNVGTGPQSGTVWRVSFPPDAARLA